MRVTLNIPVNQISYGKRLPVNPKALLFAIKLLQGYIFPPIKVEKKHGFYVLKGGRHRLAAHKLLGREVIKADYGIPEDPRFNKPLVHKPATGHESIPQADGYSLPEDHKPDYRNTWLEE